MAKRISALLAALILAFLAVPAALALGANTPNAIPEGFNEHDRQKLLAFFMTEDEYGVTNAEKLFPSGFEPGAPSSWGGVVWEAVNGEYRLARFDVSDLPLREARLAGSLDLSDCTSLYYLNVENTGVTGLKLSGCSSLSKVFCGYNEISSVDAAGCWALEHFTCQSNPIHTLDLKQTSTGVALLDAGPGFISMVNSDSDNKITAHVPSGYVFKGWMNGEGTLVSMSETFTSSVYIDTPIIMTALMEEALGDANSDGVLSSADLSALFAYVMNAGSLTEQGLMNADVSRDGYINALDVTLLAQLIFGA